MNVGKIMRSYPRSTGQGTRHEHSFIGWMHASLCMRQFIDSQDEQFLNT